MTSDALHTQRSFTRTIHDGGDHYLMMDIIFEWDEEKALTNFLKHGVSFDEASTIFADERSLTLYDEMHSTYEDRYIDIGISVSNRLLIVVYTEREERIRIISVRSATANERRQYEQREEQSDE